MPSDKPNYNFPFPETPTAVFDLFVDGDLKHTVEADSRGEAGRKLKEAAPEYARLSFQGRVEIRVREHRHEPAAGNISVCVFCQARIDRSSEAKVALEEAIKLCHRANMDDNEIKQYVRGYLTAIDH